MDEFKDLRKLPLNAFITVDEFYLYVLHIAEETDGIKPITQTHINHLISLVPQQRFNDGSTLINLTERQALRKDNRAPFLEAIKIGSERRGMWLITFESYNTWLDWHMRKRVRPYPR